VLAAKKTGNEPELFQSAPLRKNPTCEGTVVPARQRLANVSLAASGQRASFVTKWCATNKEGNNTSSWRFPYQQKPGEEPLSAPKTNIETQKRRHGGPLIGMALVVIFGVGLILYWLFEEAAQGDSPGAEQAEQQDLGPSDATDPLPQPEDDVEGPAAPTETPPADQ
jgi:hypothetical protein